MLAPPTILLASCSTVLADAIEAGLLDCGFAIRRLNSANTALEALRSPEVSLAMLDADLPGMAIEQLLAGIHASSDERHFAIVLIADEEISEWKDRLAEGAIDDLCPRILPPFQWRARLEIALRTFRQARELEHLRASMALNRGVDPRTGLHNRAALLSMLFRETDRVQRMNTPLSIMRFDIGDVAQWQARVSAAGSDGVLKQVAERCSGSCGPMIYLPGCAARGLCLDFRDAPQ